MSGCRCEPHASGTNRCAFCQAEGIVRQSYAGDTAKLKSAVDLITAISKDLVGDTGCACDTWLENNGYDCETKRRERRAAKAAELDAEIERLRAERARL